MTYLVAFQKAYTDYVTQSQRQGYTFGWFSSLRHSRSFYPHIEDLFNELKKADNLEAQKAIVEGYLKSPKTKFNNHSFSIYLLKYLTEKFPNESWEEYYPKDKQIAFYTGILYRGTLQSPQDALKKGISSKTSPRIEEFAQHTSMAVGISTSKSKGIAAKYRTSTFSTGKGVYFETGYLYKINYRGLGGIDINKTLEVRNDSITMTIGQDKQEVNIVDTIPTEDIVGYWDQKDVWHENTEYKEEKQPSIAVSIFARLEALFKKQSSTVPLDITLTDQQLTSILENPTQRKLYDFILRLPANPKNPSFSAAIKMLHIIGGNLEQKTFTEEERFATLEGRLGEISLELASQNLLSDNFRMNTYKNKLQGPFYPLVESICQFIVSTSAYKKEKLYTLMDKLIEFQNNPLFDDAEFAALQSYCQTLLQDPKFTFKRISLFGLLTSNSQDAATQLSRFLEGSKGLLLVGKLAKENGNNSNIIKELKDAVQVNNYKSAQTILSTFPDSVNKEVANNFFQRCISAQVATDFPNKKLYQPLVNPFLEYNSKQYTFDIYQLKKIMEGKPKNKDVGFVFSIDQFGNILFSEDNDLSKHVNLCKPPAIGAGEVFLKNTDSGIELTCITNRSGLYRPSDEFIKPLKDIFRKVEINVRQTMFRDERQNQISDWVQSRRM
ncbi:Uncharacterised protein [Legionella beliardensis]|uniref:Uncharacterized protein n=2 Tax=Legionella beliardensis TaxID=91822 RepID=A0A378HZY8_9GAMM|nr:Uncharacterised protein [Legionella beliardensis]